MIKNMRNLKKEKEEILNRCVSYIYIRGKYFLEEMVIHITLHIKLID